MQNWTYQPIGGFLRIIRDEKFIFGASDTLIVSYRAYPITLRRQYESEALQELDSSLTAEDEESLNSSIFDRQQRRDAFGTELNQSGSLSRGIIVGTNQDFALESGLNFELSGQLTEDLSIEAALTDRSIPIQPEGTTQNLKEFDRVFIQLRSPTTTIQMGDVDVDFTGSSFARLNRRLQGAAAYNSSGAGNYSGAVSVARGRYRRVDFQGQDGVQGPYRLTGGEGEEFVIVLAGTERVYINGQQVQRGEENEYVIDYGLGEVYFTNNILIKDETRIQIEYEYVDRNFNRTLVAGEGRADLWDGKLNVGVSVLRQADANDLLSQRSLTESDIDRLELAGDDPNAAIVSGAELYDPEQDEGINIRYARIDTTVNAQSYTIYENRPGSPNAIYKVTFSNVGEGEGSYIRSGDPVNGIVYEWVGPGLGSYEPFRRLPAPIKQQMAAMNAELSLSPGVVLFGEWAISDFDRNRFSALDDNDNVDFSYEGGIGLKDVSTEWGKLNGQIRRRYIGEKFEFFERVREVEFSRKWDLPALQTSEEAVNEALLGLAFSDNSGAELEYGFIDRNGFRGQRQASSLSLNETEAFGIDYRQDWVWSENDPGGLDGDWFRQQGNIYHRIQVGSVTLRPYLAVEQERRIQRFRSTDSLTQNSQAFVDVGPGLAWEAGNLAIDYSLTLRNDQAVLDDQLRKESGALEHKLSVNLEAGRFLETRNQFRYRTKEFEEAFLAQGRGSNRNALLVRSNTHYIIDEMDWDGELRYEVNTRRQALFQETYIEVGPELGQYVWDDLNGDGVEQIDEFFPELSPNEGNYIRQLLPSDTLFPVIDLKTRFRNELNPFSFLSPEGPFSGFLRQIGLYSRLDIAENSTTEELPDVYLLRLDTFRNDSTTIQGSLSWEQRLELFSGYEGIDVDISYNQYKSRSRRSTELIDVGRDSWSIRSEVDLSARVRGDLNLSTATDRTLSNALSSRNFDIGSRKMEMGVHGTVNRSWRAGLTGSYTYREDEAPLIPTIAKTFKLRFSSRAFLFRSIQSNAYLEIRNTRLRGSSSSYGIFELTEGLGEGTNLIWNIGGSHRMNDLIRISFTYDGRTVKDRPDVHAFRLVVNAVF